jgi:hypothetical protein
MEDASEIVADVDRSVSEWRDHLRDVADWFHEHEGDMFERSTAIELVADEFELSDRQANKVVSALVSDVVDPVVQAVHEDGKHVGIVEYHEYPESGAYGYMDVSDVAGSRRRVVCARCVETAEVDRDVANATAGENSFTDRPDASYEALRERVEQHYEDSHDVVPESVETGANLSDPTEIGGNTAMHTGNGGVGSGFDADTVDGIEASSLGRGGLNLTSHFLDTGQFTELAVVPNVPSGTTLTVNVASVSNVNANSPAGLNLIIRDLSNGATFKTYSSGFQQGQPLNEINVGGKDIAIIVDNGNYGSGTGSSQTVTALLEANLR